MPEVLRWLAALVAGAMPRRYWSDADPHLPILRTALPSALLYLLLAGVIGVPGFFAHAERNSARAVGAMLEATGWRAVPNGSPRPSDGAAIVTWTASYLSVLTFLTATPVGWMTCYLWLVGIYRAVSCAVDDPHGDPLLTGVDALSRRAWQTMRARRRRLARERREGPDLPDRLLRGRTAAFPDADFVVVTVRRKAEWEPGTFVLTTDRWYKLGIAVERDTPSGLRTLYPLTEIRTNEVLRRGVRYDLPELGTEELGN